MQTYQDIVKELVTGISLYDLENKTKMYPDVTGLLSWESRERILKALREKYKDVVEDKLPESKRFFFSREALTSFLDFLVNEDIREEVGQFLLEEFKAGVLTLKHVPEFSSRLQRVQEFFALNDVSTRLLSYYFIAEQEEYSLRHLIGRGDKKFSFINNHILFPDKSEVINALSINGALYQCGILRRRGDDFSLAPKVEEFLLWGGTEAFTDSFEAKYNKDILALSSFDVSTQKAEVMQKLLQSKDPVNLLFEGVPGTGKTSLAFSLAQEAGLTPLYLKRDVDFEENGKMLLYSARRLATRTNRVLIVDEADDILSQKHSFFIGKTRENDKAWINTFLDSNEGKVIWITNKTGNIEDSTARRFNYVLKFRELSFKQRKQIWTNTITKHGKEWIGACADFEQIVRKYDLDAGSIDDAVYRSPDQAFLTHYLDQKMEFLGRKSVKNEGPRSSYCLEALNLSTPPRQILEALRKFEARRDTIPNFNLLFQGPSGCGKTEFVNFLGQELNKEVNMLSVSDLSSMWVGETEKNIRRAFETAEATDSILFLDEADSFFQSREGAARSWEVTQVNELLVRMENFRGILVCSTNFLNNFDPASLRRFQFKLRFDYLNETGKRLLFQKYFPDKGNAVEEFVSGVRGLSCISAGDFKNVALRLQYQDNFECQDIIREFAEEVSYKKERRGLGLHF